MLQDISTTSRIGTGLVRTLIGLVTMTAVQAANGGTTGDWILTSPYPYPPLSSSVVVFATPMHGYIVGTETRTHGIGPTFLRETLDGGQTWTTVTLPAIPPGFQHHVQDVFFVDDLHGWIVGNEFDNFRTVDGGLTWQAMDISLDTLGAVNFLDANFGWARGFNGGIWISSDGGATWQSQSVGGNPLASVDFFNPQLGIAFSGQNGLWRTTDGGASWTQVQTGSFTYSPKFLSANVLVVGVFPTGLMRSIDGGVTWNTVPNQNDEYIVIEAFTPDIAIAVTPAGDVIRTTDAGATWSPVAFIGSFGFDGFTFVNETTAIRLSQGVLTMTTDAGATWTFEVISPTLMKAATFRTATDGLAVGLSGILVETTDGGATWDFLSNGIGDELTSIAMFDDLRGLAVGDGGDVVRTTDGGVIWTPSQIFAATLQSLQTIGDQTAFAVGDLGVVAKTTDGGQTWTTANIAGGQFDLFDVDFINANEGWTVAGFPDSVIFHTVDGGATWSFQLFQGGIGFFAVDFIDANHGWVAGPSGFIMRTVDGGSTWNLVNVPIGSGVGSHSKFDIRFIDANVGWLVGNFGYAAKTTDGGLTWTNHDIAQPESMFSLHVVSAQELWAATFSGQLYHSIDGGITWTPEPTGFENDSTVGFDSIFVTTSGDVWVSGTSGIILKRPALLFPPGDFNGDGGYPHAARKNRYVSFVPDPANVTPHTYQVTHVGSDVSFFISTPRTTPPEIAGLGYTFVVSDTDPVAAGLLFDFATQPIVHIGGCLIAPGETYEVRATTDGVSFSAPLTVTTASLPTNGRFWADAVGVFSAMGDANTTPPTPAGAWTPPDGTMNGFDVTAAIRGFQKTNQPDNTWTDLNPLSQDRITNGNDILRFVNAFSTGSGKEFYPFPTPASCTAGPGMDIPPEAELVP